jgi:hypothetical protein
VRLLVVALVAQQDQVARLVGPALGTELDVVHLLPSVAAHPALVPVPVSDLETESDRDLLGLGPLERPLRPHARAPSPPRTQTTCFHVLPLMAEQATE